MSEEKTCIACYIQLTVEEYEALCRLSTKLGITKEEVLESAIKILDGMFFGKCLVKELV